MCKRSLLVVTCSHAVAAIGVMGGVIDNFQLVPKHGTDSQHAQGMSRDGRVIFGSAPPISAMVRWTDLGFPESIPPLSGGSGLSAMACNSDGSVIVGSVGYFGSERPARWMPLGGTRILIPTGAFSVGASTVVSDNGSVIAGRSNNGPFVWTKDTGAASLPGSNSPPASPLDILAISNDGQVIGGSARLVNGSLAPMLTGAGPMKLLPSGGGDFPDANVWALSADGNTAVGVDRKSPSGGDGIAVWRTGGVEYLPRYNPNTGGIGNVAISADAQVVAWTDPGLIMDGVVWTKATGVFALREILICYGYPDVANFRLDYPYGLRPIAISGDGSRVIGNVLLKTGGEAIWILDFSRCPADLNGDGVVDDSDFLVFVSSYSIYLDIGGDLNLDCVTDDSDFSLFVPYYDNLICP